MERKEQEFVRALALKKHHFFYFVLNTSVTTRIVYKFEKRRLLFCSDNGREQEASFYF
jgi:hypothetical protein